jgi:hypothetical protein
MSCCNRRRVLQAARPRPAPAAPAPRPVPAAAAVASGGEVLVRFTGAGRVRVQGAVSGRVYHASAADPVVAARPEDARALLRSGLFTAA